MNQSVALAAELVVHALPMKVHPTGSTDLHPALLRSMLPHCPFCPLVAHVTSHTCLLIKFHFYLNDWLICHHDLSVLVEHLTFVLNPATPLGWLVNLEKAVLVPSQQFIYLGLDFDTQLALVRPSLKCVERLEACIHLFLQWPCPLASKVINAIHGVFKNSYFFSICTTENLSSLSIIMLRTSDLMI